MRDAGTFGKKVSLFSDWDPKCMLSSKCPNKTWIKLFNIFFATSKLDRWEKPFKVWNWNKNGGDHSFAGGGECFKICLKQQKLKKIEALYTFQKIGIAEFFVSALLHWRVSCHLLIITLPGKNIFKIFVLDFWKWHFCEKSIYF